MQGEIVILLSQAAWAVGALYLKKLVDMTNPIIATSLIAVLGTLPLIPLFLFYSKDIVSLPKEQLLWAGLRGVLWISVGGLLYAYGLSKAHLSHGALLALTYPFFAFLLAIFFLGEPFTFRLIVAGSLFVAGFLILTL